MKKTVLIGGKAGQGINIIAEIIASVLSERGYFVFNYRDYPSLIRGGHNFNVLTISDKNTGSTEHEFDAVIAMDDVTIEKHKKELTKDGILIGYEEFKELGRNVNIAQAAAYLKIVGIPFPVVKRRIQKKFNNEAAMKAVEKGYNSQKETDHLKQLKNNIKLITGSQGIAQGAVNSKLQLYIGYPMTPSTPVLHALAAKQNNDLMVFEGENEIGCVSMALGASFTGAHVMTGTSGGGFDLMTEHLSMQGISEIPLTVYLVSRPGPGTGVPTYTSQGDLDLALRAGHGEFPRIVVAPGNGKECIEKTNEALFLAEKFKILSIILSDKHIGESQFSYTTKIQKPLEVKLNRPLPHKQIVKASSYESLEDGNTTEDAEVVKKNQDNRIQKYKEVKKFIEKNFEMVKFFGKKNSKNLIIGWGSTKGVILDAIEGLDCEFMQVLYAKPLSPKVKEKMIKAKNIILVENNLTGQMGRLLRERTGVSIPEKNRILKYDGRPFWTSELHNEIQKRLKK